MPVITRISRTSWVVGTVAGLLVASSSAWIWHEMVVAPRAAAELAPFILGGGVLLAAALGWSLVLAQAARGRAQAIARSNDRLQMEITERERAQEALRQSEEQLRQSQKMEAIGRLAGGVAHDFNNLLTAINGYSDFLLESLDRNDARRDDVREIRKASTRAAALTSQLLAFSRRQIRQPRVLDLNTVVADLGKMLRRVIGEDIEIRTVFASGIGAVKADPSQIEQILLNLVVNAGDAMPDGGVITIETRDVVLDQSAASRVSAQAGRYVLLRVIDTGHGMDDATMARVFEPFFTTKAPGRGTGLGLATVYAAVQQSGGAINIQSAPGAGATFSVYLPTVAEEPDVFASGSFAPTAPRGTETILLAEDEDGVRSLTARILERHGYTVLEARTGRDALNIAEEHSGGIDLLITDVVMPELGGRKLAELLADRRPSTDVLFMSGYTDGEISRRGEIDPETAFLQKPFTAQALLLKVREVLAA